MSQAKTYCLPTLLVHLSVAAGGLLLSCDNSARVKAFSDQATLLSKEWAPKLDAASEQLLKLRSRLALLPPEQAADVDKSMSNINSRIQTARNALSVLPSKIQSAGEGGKLAEIPTELQQVTETVSGSLSSFGNELDGFTDRIAAMESKFAEGRIQGADEIAVPFEKRLPSGFIVVGHLSGIEQQVLAFVENLEKPVDKTTWFSFDRLSFVGTTAELDLRSSSAQLDNMAEILGTYGKVRFHVGGYTDNTGSATENKQLSKERAQSVVRELVSRGIGAKRLTAEGYGPANPVCPANDTEACKAQNRRIAIRVTAK